MSGLQLSVIATFSIPGRGGSGGSSGCDDPASPETRTADSFESAPPSSALYEASNSDAVKINQLSSINSRAVDSPHWHRLFVRIFAFASL